MAKFFSSCYECFQRGVGQLDNPLLECMSPAVNRSAPALLLLFSAQVSEVKFQLPKLVAFKRNLRAPRPETAYFRDDIYTAIFGIVLMLLLKVHPRLHPMMTHY
ncbi:uncharacterized protein [Bemisia tabaci]|uniref:uncharacterized protein n=1 Tax=Bemisia tabaci TaxID=7038 RepID=UPI003B28D5B9